MHKLTAWICLIIIANLSIPNRVYTQTIQASKLQVNLQKCIELTLKNNNSQMISVHAIESAGYKVKQARSAHYPKVSLSSALTLNDQDPNYISPPTNIQTPAMNLGVFSIPSLTFEVPAQTIKMADKLNFQAQVDLVFPLFVGGKITSLVEQAESGLEIARQDARLNSEKIIYESKKLYNACILSTKLEEIASDAYERLKTTLELTESLYLKGSGRVTKIEYLKNKTMVEVVKSILSGIQGEKKIAHAALVNAIGLDWNTELEVVDSEIELSRVNDSLESLVARLLESNPNFMKIDNGLNAYKSRVDEAKSDLYPSLAIVGTYRGVLNNYDYGTITPENKNIWVVGLGLSMNLFDGLRTFARIDEANANFNQLSEQREMLRKGLILKLQYLYHKAKSNEERESSSKLAMLTSMENRELIEKAYLNDIKELEDVLQAQLTEAMMKAQYQMLRFECSEIEAQLSQLLAGNTNSVVRED